MLDGNQLAEDADGDFLRGNRADVEPDRRVDPLEGVGDGPSSINW